MPATGATAIQQNITIQAGASFFLTFTTEDQNGDPIDLTDATSIRGEIRSRDGRLLATFFTANAIPPTLGIINLSLTAAQTIALEAQIALFPAQYDIIVAFANTAVDRVLKGVVLMSRHVTV